MLTIPDHKGKEIKTTLRFHLTPVRIATIKTSTTTNAGEDVGKGTLIHYWWECKLVQYNHFGKQYGGFFKN
jgi:hypothetical protein